LELLFKLELDATPEVFLTLDVANFLRSAMHDFNLSTLYSYPAYLLPLAAACAWMLPPCPEDCPLYTYD